MATQVFAATIVASSETTGKKCGDNCTWTLDSDGVMTISGSGDMPQSFNGYSNQPWDGYINQVKVLNIGKDITSIGGDAFAGFSNLTTVNFAPDTALTKIYGWSFHSTSKLKEFNIPANVDFIGNGVFYGSGIESLTLPENIKSIGTYFVDSASSLKSINIPDGVESIGYRAFRLTQVESIVIPDSVKYIDDEAFSAISSLKSITIAPNADLVIDPDAFHGITGHITIYCAGDAATCDQKLAAAGYGYLKSVEVPPLKKKGTKRTYYTPAEAAQHVNHTNNNKVIFTFK